MNKKTVYCRVSRSTPRMQIEKLCLEKKKSVANKRISREGKRTLEISENAMKYFFTETAFHVNVFGRLIFKEVTLSSSCTLHCSLSKSCVQNHSDTIQNYRTHFYLFLS